MRSESEQLDSYERGHEMLCKRPDEHSSPLEYRDEWPSMAGRERITIIEFKHKATPEMDNEYKFVGNFSAVDPAYSRDMRCDKCKVRWIGCWDNFQCPKCGEGELPECKPTRDNLSIQGLEQEAINAAPDGGDDEKDDVL